LVILQKQSQYEMGVDEVIPPLVFSCPLEILLHLFSVVEIPHNLLDQIQSIDVVYIKYLHESSLASHPVAL
jgi:hypothetical protein